MALKASDQPNLSIDFGDEDGPVTFKRYTSSKKKQLHSELAKSTSNSHGQSNRQSSNAPSSNGQASSNQKGNIVPSSKASPIKSSVGNSKASSSLVNASSLKPKPVFEQKISVHIRGETKSINYSTKDNAEDSEDEEDNKPFSTRLKINSNNDNKATPIVAKKSYEDSNDDDDMPLSAKMFWKSNAQASCGNYDDSDVKKPILEVQKERQNRSSATNKYEKPSTLPAKRPIDNSNSMHTSVKKLKVSDPAASIITKQVSMKCEPKVDDDDDDNIPISKRIKKPLTSADKSSSIYRKSAMPADKSSSTKNSLTKVTKVNKDGKTSFKKQPKKLNKTGKGSDYSKSTKILPSSGDGQKKWTTLVHNGVIFPPPYQPHGVKILYKGKTVDLTLEQEEVATMYAVMRDTEYMLKDKFKENFWNDWRKLLGRNHVIHNLKDCDFTPIYAWYQNEKEKKKQMSTEEKKAQKEEKTNQEEKYMWAIVDGVKEKV